MRDSKIILVEFHEKCAQQGTTADVLKKLYIEALSTGKCTLSEINSMISAAKKNGSSINLTADDTNKIARTITSTKQTLFSAEQKPLLGQQPKSEKQSCPCAAM